MNAPAKRQRAAARAGGVNEEEAVARVPDEPDVRAVLQSITEEQSMNTEGGGWEGKERDRR